MQTPAAKTGHTVDLTNCDREPIHIPGNIQPHGVLFRIDETNFNISHVSESCREILGLEAGELIGTPLLQLIHESQATGLKEKLLQPDLAKYNPHKLAVRFGVKGELRSFDGIAHRYKGNLILELEPSRERAEVEFTSFYHRARESVQLLRATKSLPALLESAAGEVRKITGFDRVVVYRFDENWDGHVLAEEKREGMDSYLGLHFPASDIPKQARDLYTLNTLRIIPTVEYKPSRLMPAPFLASGEPIDLSLSILRSVSPIHIEYLRNMEVSASMSISIMKNNRLWGLISCTHGEGPLYLPYDVRAICDFIGETLSSLLPLRESEEDFDYRVRLTSIRDELLSGMTRSDDFVASLARQPDKFLAIANATGGAIYFGGQTTLIGDTPDEQGVAEIIRWLSEKKIDEVFSTASLPQLLKEAEGFKDKASGLLAFPVARSGESFFMWFRPEVIQTVDWSGNPNKPVEKSGEGDILHPRKSFELWKETVRLRSLPWRAEEKSAVASLRASVIENVLQRMERITRLNVELERSNTELDSFAYAASHDLKEPLRGINNYIAIIHRDAGHLLPEDARSRMQTVARLAQRMEDLINSLLHYSQIGRAEMITRETDLGDVVKQALDSIRSRLEGENVEISVPSRLPVVICDRVQMTEVFTNLISNAVKYNEQKKKIVEITVSPPLARAQSPVITVRDNGIGIDPMHFDSVFKIFKRLHGKEKFGGGTGTGLTITKKIIERHGGRIWVDSVPGEGSRFSFFLSEGAVHV